LVLCTYIDVIIVLISGTAEGEKTIGNLLVEQLEFANVIILNKVDLVAASTVPLVQNLIKKINPKAKVLTSSFSSVDVKEIINTGLFSMEVNMYTYISMVS
jgi:G3E family GTPase